MSVQEFTISEPYPEFTSSISKLVVAGRTTSA